MDLDAFLRRTGSNERGRLAAKLCSEDKSASIEHTVNAQCCHSIFNFCPPCSMRMLRRLALLAYLRSWLPHMPLYTSLFQMIRHSGWEVLSLKQMLQQRS